MYLGIPGNDWAMPKIVCRAESGQKWHKNQLYNFNTVQS